MLQILMDPAQFSKVAATTTAEVIRTFKEMNRHAFLAHFENSICDWKSDDVKATIIAEKFASKIRNVVIEKNDPVHKVDPNFDGMSAGDIKADNDQQELWSLRTEQAAEGLKSARSWQGLIQQCLNELSHVKVCWDNMWYLYELGLDETSETLKEAWTGLLSRYSLLLDIQRHVAASESTLCAAMGAQSMAKLKVIDNGKRIEEDLGDQRKRRPEFVWESYRSRN
jgi:hypothetical protein